MKTFTALAAITLIAAPAQAGYITCQTTRDDGQAMTFAYTTNEAASTLAETVVNTGSMSTHRAVYAANTIVAPFRVAGFGGQIELNRQTGEVRRELAGTTWQGTCQADKAPAQLF